MLDRVGTAFNLGWQILSVRDDLHRGGYELRITEQADDVAHNAINLGAPIAQRRFQIGKTLHDVANAIQFFIEYRHFADNGLLLFQLAAENAEIVLDDREWVVDFVSNPTRSLPVFLRDTGRPSRGFTALAQGCLERCRRLFAKRSKESFAALQTVDLPGRYSANHYSQAALP